MTRKIHKEDVLVWLATKPEFGGCDYDNWREHFERAIKELEKDKK